MIKLNIYSFWLGDSKEKKELLDKYNKLERINKKIKFNLGPSNEEHEYLLKEFKFYKHNFDIKNYAYCSDVWRLYKYGILIKNQNKLNKSLHLYLDSRTIINTDKLDDLINILWNNKNVLLLETPWKIWNGFIYTNNLKFIEDSLNFYYKCPKLTNKKSFIGPILISISMWNNFKHKEKEIYFLDSRDLCIFNNKQSYFKYNGTHSWIYLNKKNKKLDNESGTLFFQKCSRNFENNSWKMKKINKWIMMHFYIIYWPIFKFKMKFYKPFKL